MCPDLTRDRNGLVPNLVARDSLIDHLRDALASRSPLVREIAEEGLRSWPADPELLLLAALAALAMDLPERALSLLKRYGKRYVPGKPVTLLMALALASAKTIYPCLDDAARCRTGH